MGEFNKADVLVLGISFDSVEANARFARCEQFPFRLLSDTKRTVGIAYGACKTPDAPAAKRITYLIDAQGRVEKVWQELKPAEHARAVVAHLQAAS